MSDTTGLGAFRQQWWGNRQPLGFPSFLTGQNSPDGQATPAQGDQGAQQQAQMQAQQQAMVMGMRARMRASIMQGADPDVAQNLQTSWANEDMGQAQTPQARIQALQAQARRQQLRMADPDVAQHLQNAWAAQDRAGG